MRGAILIGIAGDHRSPAWVAGPGSASRPQPYDLAAIGADRLPARSRRRVRPSGSHGLGLFEILFVFLFVDLFDNIGTLVGGHQARRPDRRRRPIPRLNRILFTDAIATIFGSLRDQHRHQLCGERRGRAGGRPHRPHRDRDRPAVPAGDGGGALCAVWCPLAATAPALILVGALMMAPLAEIGWHEPLVAVPAFLTLVMIPLTFSIANGLGFGIIAWAVLHLITGRSRRQDWLLYVLAALFLARFIYLGAS